MSRRRRLAVVTPLAAAAAVAAVYLALFLAARFATSPVADHDFFAPRPGRHRPLVFAHQGGEALAPSNTMAAFTNAVELGADVLDADLHLTADRVPVLLHDTTVDRTSDGTGAVADLTLAELRSLDFGYSFSPGGDRTPGTRSGSRDDDGAGTEPDHPFRGRGVGIVTVEELFSRFDGIRFNIEIKQTVPDAATIFCDLIRRFGYQHKVLVSSFGQANMDAFRAACPEVATAATEGEVRTFYVLHRLGLSGLAGGLDAPAYQSLQVPEFAEGRLILSPGFVSDAQDLGLAVIPWTINDRADLERIMALGVDGINTDHPDRLVELRSSSGD